MLRKDRLAARAFNGTKRADTPAQNTLPTAKGGNAMLPHVESDKTMRHVLSPLLPPNVPPEAFFPAEALESLDSHRAELEALGFELDVREHNLRIRHGLRKFDFVTQFSDQDDLGERRRLFGALKETFGSFWDRFGWFMQPSPPVTVPYEHLKAVLGICQAARVRLRRVT